MLDYTQSVRHKVLVIEDDSASMRVLKRVIGKARLQAVCAESLTQARHIFGHSTPEDYLCAVVDYTLPDALTGQAIDFALESYLPVIVIADVQDEQVREHILSKDVVDYIPKDNAQVFEYLSRLLARLEKNKHIGVLVASSKRSTRGELSGLLLRHNFVAYEATSLDQSLSSLRANSDIKLVICDEHIENGQTMELIADIRKLYDKDDVSVIGVSGDRQTSPVARYIKSGANDYLVKPFCQEEFFCRVMQNVEQLENIEAIRAAAYKDYLTGLPNRRHFFSRTEQILKRSPAQHVLALMDLDHFKSINDNYGHDGGDYVLKEIALAMQEHFPQDIIARFGGEEFCVYFSDSSLEEAKRCLEIFRKHIDEKLFHFGDHNFHASVSIGVTDVFEENIESMLRGADELLYSAKQAGRNRVIASA